MSNPEAATPALDSTEAKLAELKAKRKALAAQAKAEAEAASLAEAVQLEERALRDDEAVAKARKVLGKGNYALITGVNAKTFDTVIVKRSHAAAFKAFQDKEAFKLEDLEALVEPCIEYPPRDEFSAEHTHRQPGLLTRAGEAVFYLAGVRKNLDLGKA